ncbi:MAG TPA: hypothetical protein VMG59_03455 [Phycisphaerae bacterium]|nr:hypothetical protein [Phycisphaerae bacterium]
MGDSITQSAQDRNNWRLRLALLLTSPVVILCVMCVGIVGLSLLKRPLYLEEMFIAALLSVTVGVLAVLPMAILISRGAVLLIRCAQLAIMIRLVGPIIGVLIVLLVPAWHAHRQQILIWLLAFYFVLYLVENLVSSWAFKHACAS